ncbi:MAG: FG-GAP repeat protein, partial [Planctomycetota bacterium]
MVVEAVINGPLERDDIYSMGGVEMKGKYLVFFLLVVAAVPALAVTEQQKLLPSDGTQGDVFGSAVAVDGDTAVVGARSDDDGGVKAGAAYVFSRDAAGFWSEQQKLLASDRTQNDRFGESVAVDGDTVLIADRWKDSGIGAVYVFIRDSSGFWSEQQKLVPADTEGLSGFGRAMALEGDTAIIGAPSYNRQAGAVWVFNRQGDGFWSEAQKIEGTNVPGPCPTDPCSASGPGFFGDAIHIDGDTALIGAPFEDDNGGAAYIYKRDGSGLWTEHQRLFAAEGRDIDVVGSAVALHGDTAILGAFQDGVRQNNEFPGAAYVFTRGMDDVWTERQKLTASDATEATRFGYEVALHGDT